MYSSGRVIRYSSEPSPPDTMSVTIADRPGYSADRASRCEATLEVTSSSSTSARRKCGSWRGLLTSATVRTSGATDSIAMIVRIECMSASSDASAGKTSAADASAIPARSRSSALVASPRTK